MPLDSTASIKDVIEVLREVEGINAKADFASVVGSPATPNDTMATLIGMVQRSKNELATKLDDGSLNSDPLLALVDRVTVGKQMAIGDLRVEYGTSRFNITGLGFKPTDVYYYITSYIGRLMSGIGAANNRDVTWGPDINPNCVFFAFYSGANYTAATGIASFEESSIMNLPLQNPYSGERYDIRWVAFGD